MGERRTARHIRKSREFEAFAAGASGRLLHAATLLTAERAPHNPRARELLTAALADTYASWERLRGGDPYDHARQILATRFARTAWRHRRGGHGPLAVLHTQERLVLVLRVYEGVAEEQTAAQLGMATERVRTLHARGAGTLLRPPRTAPRGRPEPAARGPLPS
ncbi:sigma factor-like helix-turn-helix DNA-binding protein [Streptomyces tsukubensis]|uniref:RNA polymerase subunit sigma-70 n=1 Tax=Streptomyces tsukubensis TaxID=83656 RepID=A0A1V4ADE7_9ACTN|nr:sigma factor-like helix-turn-helix DNA-binding protein [Streptomyces tsukubensis]OON81437.1 RNA polymerase subunit sigma-70 [Streptomyces tsukubensis]QFR95434.1 RNA polymerase subunit sigma-70 [Streptomyces tsukubensis]